MSNPRPVALLSVYDKDGITQFANDLIDLGWEIWSSGGTARHLEEAGVDVLNIASIVGKPILGHRVVTLSREIHAGILATDSAEDRAELLEHGIRRIDLVCVDMYPLERAMRTPGITHADVIEKTDIGGPTMLRAAAKARRIVVCDSADRVRIVDWLKENRPNNAAFLEGLAARAERRVERYVEASARYLARDIDALNALAKYGIILDKFKDLDC